MTDKESVPEKMNRTAEQYEEKDADYGSSYKLGGEIVELMMKSAGVEAIRLPADARVLNSFFMWGRRLDKSSRGFNGEFLAESMNFESTEDAHEDEGCYAFMHSELLGEYADDSAAGATPIRLPRVGDSVKGADEDEERFAGKQATAVRQHEKSSDGQ